MIVKIINSRTGTDIALKAKLADNFWIRAMGLQFKRSFEKGDAMVFPKCNGVHTLFSRFNLDIIFLDKNRVVTNVIENLPKWRFSPFILKPLTVIELPAGTIKETGTMIGDELVFEKSECP